MALLSSLRQIAGIESGAMSQAFMPEFFKLVLGTLSLPINLPNTNYHRGFQVNNFLSFVFGTSVSKATNYLSNHNVQSLKARFASTEASTALAIVLPFFLFFYARRL